MTAPGCPLHSDTTDSHRKALKPGETTPAQRVNRRDAMWRIGSLAAANEVLLARHETIQAGHTSAYIPRHAFRSHPLLISHGPQHHEPRRKVARFFAPRLE